MILLYVMLLMVNLLGILGSSSIMWNATTSLGVLLGIILFIVNTGCFAFNINNLLDELEV